MNIFVTDLDPIVAAQNQCDKHIPKMVVESAQMMATAVRRWGATDEQMPLTKKGKPYKGGYPDHPCTIWVGDIFGNFNWLNKHAMELCRQYTLRFGKIHACQTPIEMLWRLGMTYRFQSPTNGTEFSIKRMTAFALAMPDEYRPDWSQSALHGAILGKNKKDEYIITHARGKDAVNAYRDYYIGAKPFAKWEKGTDAPDWWPQVEVVA